MESDTQTFGPPRQGFELTLTCSSSNENPEKARALAGLLLRRFKANGLLSAAGVSDPTELVLRAGSLTDEAVSADEGVSSVTATWPGNFRRD